VGSTEGSAQTAWHWSLSSRSVSHQHWRTENEHRRTANVSEKNRTKSQIAEKLRHCHTANRRLFIPAAGIFTFLLVEFNHLAGKWSGMLLISEPLARHLFADQLAE